MPDFDAETLKTMPAKDLPRVPIQVEGEPMLTTGYIVREGNNPWVCVSDNESPTFTGRRRTWEGRFSWAAVVEALNIPGVRLPMPKRR